MRGVESREAESQAGPCGDAAMHGVGAHRLGISGGPLGEQAVRPGTPRLDTETIVSSVYAWSGITMRHDDVPLSYSLGDGGGQQFWHSGVPSSSLRLKCIQLLECGGQNLTDQVREFSLCRRIHWYFPGKELRPELRPLRVFVLPFRPLEESHHTGLH